AHADGREIQAADNFGVRIGAALGELALRGRDKLTLVLGDEIAALGAWIEQLVAESTGKEGRGIVPIDGEPLAGPELYGSDRVCVEVGADPAAETRRLREALRSAGHPVLRWSVPEPLAIGASFLRWEIATATVGAVLGIDPFDEPNVAEAKAATH